MKWFIIYQMIINKIERVGFTQNTEMSVTVRKVRANSKEEAIGKFVIETANIQAIEKLQVQCDELDQLQVQCDELDQLISIE